MGSILPLIVSSSIVVSLESSMVLLTSFVLHGVGVDLTLLAAAFALTFAVYTFDRAFEQKEDLINDPDRSTVFLGSRLVWAVAGTVSLIACLVLGSRRGPSVVLTLMSPLAVYASYSLGLPSMPRLKDIPGVKNIVLVATWALVPTLLPNLVEAGRTDETTTLVSVLIFSFIFAKIMANSILFDVRDVKGDAVSGVRTLPVVLGVSLVRRILFLLNGMLILWVGVCWLMGLFLQYLPFLAGSVAYGFWYIDFFTRKLGRKRMLLDLLVDGEWVPLAVVIALVYTRC